MHELVLERDMTTATESTELTLESVRDMAAGIGLTRLAPEHLAQLLQSTREAQARRASLPFSDLTYADEPAHVYRLPEA
jgi:hypothetical protein